MKYLKFAFVIVILILLLTNSMAAQVPIVGSPVTLEIGLGGGISIPMGTLADFNNTGYHLGGKVRIGGWLPIHPVASANYNSLPEKSTENSDRQWILSAGLEWPIPSVIISPYLGADALYTIFKNEGVGTSDFKRGGIGLGGGVAFPLLGFGTIDASVKYQMLNVFGKEANEETLSQVMGNVVIIFSLP